MVNIYPCDDTAYCTGAVGQFIEQVFFEHPANDIAAYQANSTNPIYPKYRHYSSHDVSHVNIGRCLGIPFTDAYNTSFPEYAAMLVIESTIDDTEGSSHGITVSSI